MHYKVLYIVFVLLLVQTVPILAEQPLLNQSTRLQNMGGVYASLPSNLDLLTLNPASLGNIEDSKLTLLHLMLDLNGDTVSTTNDFLNAYGDVDSTWDLSAEDVQKLARYEPHLRLAGPFQLSYIRKHWAFSLVNTNARLFPDFVLPGTHSTVDLAARGDATAMVAYGQRVYRGLSAGMSLRYQFRAELFNTDVEETTDDDVLYLRRGLGFDLGLLYPLQRWPLYIGLAYYDVFNTNLSEERILLDSGDTIDGTEQKISQQIRLGVTYEPDVKIPLGRMAYFPLRTLLSLEFGAGDSFGERIHIGSEVQLFRWLAVRLGINRGIRLGIGLGTQTLFLDYMFASRLEDRKGVHSTSIMWRY